MSSALCWTGFSYTSAYKCIQFTTMAPSFVFKFCTIFKNIPLFIRFVSLFVLEFYNERMSFQTQFKKKNYAYLTNMCRAIYQNEQKKNKIVILFNLVNLMWIQGGYVNFSMKNEKIWCSDNLFGYILTCFWKTIHD